MKGPPRLSRSRRQLNSLRLDIARAEAELSVLNAAIREARSDAGLAAFEGVRVENRHLLATNLLAAQAATASQTALDIAVMASQTDPLTGLRNRSVLWDRLSHELEVASRLGQHVGVLLLDLDDFKPLNDEFGHAAGDLVLQRVANVLTASVRSSDTVCRMGGDEFVVVASIASADDAVQLAEKLTATLREPFRVADHTITVSASVGFSIFPKDGDSAESLVNKADAAMYQAKRARNAAIRA